MRVAFVSVSDQMGGSEVVLVEIMRGLRLARPGWDLHLVSPGPGPLPVAAGARAKVEATIVEMPRALATFGETARAARLLRLLRAAAAVPGYQRTMNAALDRLAPDVVHTNGFKAHVIAARSGNPARALVWHLHEYIGRRPMTRALLRRYAGRPAAIVANSQSVAEDARPALDGREIRVIPNAVDLATFIPDGPHADLDALCGRPEAPAGTIRIGLVATFARWKGHEVFLRAIAAMSARVPARAYVVGGPVYDTIGSQYSIEELQALARVIGVETRVGFTRMVDAPASALRALDIVVHASTEPEPFGMVIAEAMACGRALVTSGTGGAAALVRDGVDALVHRAGDPAHLASCLERLAGDDGLRRRLGEQARASAVRQFDSGRLARQFASLYEEAAARGTTR